MKVIGLSALSTGRLYLFLRIVLIFFPFNLHIHKIFNLLLASLVFSYSHLPTYFSSSPSPYVFINLLLMFNPLALELDNYSLAHHLCKM
jgi:hypothetical protein